MRRNPKLGLNLGRPKYHKSLFANANQSSFIMSRFGALCLFEAELGMAASRPAIVTAFDSIPPSLILDNNRQNRLFAQQLMIPWCKY